MIENLCYFEVMLEGKGKSLEEAEAFSQALEDIAIQYSKQEEIEKINGPFQELGLTTLSRHELKVLLMKDKLAGFHQLLVQYDKLFHKVAYDVLHNYDIAQDAVSIAWEKIYRWLENAEENQIREKDLLPYMCKMVLNASRDLYNSEKRQRMRIYRKEKDLIEEARWHFETPEEFVERHEMESIIHELIDQLPLKFATVIRLRFFLGDEVLEDSGNIESERYKQISMKIGCKESTVRSHKYRALERMRNLLIDRGIYK